MRVLDLREPVGALTFRPDGAVLATASEGGLQLWCPTTGALRLAVAAAGTWPARMPLSFKPDGQVLGFRRRYLDLSAAPTDGRQIDLDELKHLPTPFPGLLGSVVYDREHRCCVWLTRWSLEVRAVGNRRLLLRMGNTRGRRWRPMRVGCESMSLYGACERLAAAFLTDEVVVFDLQRKRVAGRLKHPDVVHRVVYSPDGALLATATVAARTVRLWDARKLREVARLPRFDRKLGALAFSPDGRLLAAGGNDGGVRLWDVASRKEVARYDWGVGGVAALAFAPDGMRAAVGGSEGVVVWDVDV
jgi:WD40 repeat protein